MLSWEPGPVKPIKDCKPGWGSDSGLPDSSRVCSRMFVGPLPGQPHSSDGRVLCKRRAASGPRQAVHPLPPRRHHQRCWPPSSSQCRRTRSCTRAGCGRSSLAGRWCSDAHGAGTSPDVPALPKALTPLVGALCLFRLLGCKFAGTAAIAHIAQVFRPDLTRFAISGLFARGPRARASRHKTLTGGTSRLGDALARTPWQDHGRVAQGAASLAAGTRGAPPRRADASRTAGQLPPSTSWWHTSAQTPRAPVPLR